MNQSVFDRVRGRHIATAIGLATVLAAAGCGGRASSPTASAPTVTPTIATPTIGPSSPAAAEAPAATGLPAEPTTQPTSGPTASTPPEPTTTTPAGPQPVPGVHFRTPQAAMRYLAAAWNRNDQPALKKVTNPEARAALTAMRHEATNLQLISCSRRSIGDYVCEFRHDYPASLQHHGPGPGHATFLAAPATKPGWYMTVLVGCG